MEYNLIQRIKEIVQLDETDIQIILRLFNRETVKANTYLLREGEHCKKTWFIEKGIVQFNLNMDGEYRAFIFRKEGDFTSDLESFLKDIPSFKNIITIEDSIVQSISYQNLQILFREVKQGERFGRILAEQSFLNSVSHFVSYYTESPEERYNKLISTNKELLQRIPQYLVASYLGIKPQSLSRIKRKFALKQIS